MFEIKVNSNSFGLIEGFIWNKTYIDLLILTSEISIETVDEGPILDGDLTNLPIRIP